VPEGVNNNNNKKREMGRAISAEFNLIILKEGEEEDFFILICNIDAS
jgi:hypothetical protein